MNSFTQIKLVGKDSEEKWEMTPNVSFTRCKVSGIEEKCMLADEKKFTIELLKGDSTLLKGEKMVLEMKTTVFTFLDHPIFTYSIQQKN